MASPTGKLPRARTYVVLRIDVALVSPLPLGTVAGSDRREARGAARARWPVVPPGALRVTSAGCVTTDLLARALALDGEALLR